MYIQQILIVSLVFILFSCVGTKTKVESSWGNEKYEEKTFSNIAILAAMKSLPDNINFEAEVVNEIKAKTDIECMAGYKVITPDTNLTKEQMKTALENHNFDLVAMFKLISVNAEKNYNPPTTSYTPTYYYGSYFGYYDYWYPAYRVTASEGYWSETDFYIIEVKLLDLATEELVWTAKTSTADPKNFKDLADSVTDAMLKALKNNNNLKK